MIPTMDSAMEFSFWKEEPLSPVFNGLDHADVWQLFEDDVVKQAKSPEKDTLDHLGNHGDWLPDSPGDSLDSFTDSSSCLTLNVNERAQLASEILQELDTGLDTAFIKEEPFAEWYETKADLPMFEGLPSPSPASPIIAIAPGKEEARSFASLSSYTSAFTPAAPAAVLVPLSAVHAPDSLQLQALHQPQHNNILAMTVDATGLAPATLADTETLLQEFECVFGKVEQSHGALTPPQSPPHNMTPESLHRLAMPGPAPVSQLLLDFTGGMTPNPQLIAEVDELARSRAESWPDAQETVTPGPPSPCTSSSCSSFSDDQTLPELDPPTPESDDPEWLPGSPSSPSPANDLHHHQPKAERTRKRATKRERGSKPYANTQEDKKQRKKEQNKNAATRYRMKKKAESEVILGEENELRDKNDELQAKVQDLTQEIRYLKNLMRDVFKAKGLIK